MESKTTMGILAVAILAILFFWGYDGRGSTTASIQETSSGANGVKSVLVASEVLHDFGTISMKNGNVTKEFTVTNPTGADVSIATVLTSCMCTIAFVVNQDGGIKGPFGMAGMGFVPPANELIKAGESRIIRVVYDPNAHGPAGIGRIDRFVTLTDEAGGSLELEIKANVSP